jgi:hypothetical protein
MRIEIQLQLLKNIFFLNVSIEIYAKFFLGDSNSILCEITMMFTAVIYNKDNTKTVKLVC